MFFVGLFFFKIIRDQKNEFLWTDRHKAKFSVLTSAIEKIFKIFRFEYIGSGDISE